MCREEYQDTVAWDGRRAGVQEAWPEYAESVELVSKRAYLADGNMEDKLWLDSYLRVHVQRVQEMKQNHVHLPNKNGELMPLTHCQRKDNPNKCKSDFPRQLLRRGAVLCQGLLQQQGLPIGGRRNKLGSLGGPRNESMVNGTHPVLSAMPFSQTNSDVQLPYRFPITAESHDDELCSECCVGKSDLKEIIQGMQSAQDAQVGYSCDDQNKRAARSCNEVKESMKGHRKLAADHSTKRPEYIGHRHVTRLQSDAYGRGITRSQQESTNLRAIGHDYAVTSAEFFSTSVTVQFPGVDVCKWREAFYRNAKSVDVVSAISVDWRSPHRHTPVQRNIVFLYGHRPKYVNNQEADGFSPLWHLSLYEFMVHWNIQLATYNLDLEDSEEPEEDDNDEWQAFLKASACSKIKQKLRLVPGEDYAIKEVWPKNGAWVTLPDIKATSGWRHDWVFARRSRPVDPHFARCPMPREGAGEVENNAALILTYFHPFTLDAVNSDEHVPHMNQLCKPGSTWQQTMLQWFNGNILCTEAKTYIDNFLAVTRARPFEDELLEHSEDNFSDEDLCVDKSNFDDVVKTRMGSGGAKKADSKDAANDMGNSQAHPDAVVDAFNKAEQLWPVTEEAPNKLKYEGVSKLSAEDVDKAIASASASQKKDFADQSHIEQTTKNDAPTTRQGKAYTDNDIWTWFEQQRQKGTVRQKQLEMLRVICQRLVEELAEAGDGVSRSPPLMHLLHGGPGNGKSEVLKMMRRLFQEVCGWEQGLDFQIMTLQAVTAEALDADTIHHALGINPFTARNDAKSRGKASQRQAEVAKQVSQWRWIFVDEISMVSAKLLAEVDMKLRNMVSNLERLKTDSKGVSRAFGGINIVFAGDFWQIDPPGGGFLGAIPVEFIRRARQYDPKPDVAHGQSIFWHSGEGCVQGMTELTECVRTEDEWLYAVQQEMRHGRLSLDSWKFLHGHSDTSVPGSWVNGRCTCGHACEETWKLRRQECDTCQLERKSKHLVMNDATDKRHLQEKFLAAPAIFPNNDIKYEVNKRRAQIFAAETQQALTWSMAKDNAGSKVIAEKPNLQQEKRTWLTRHDRDCGCLYGTLPLAKGMPVVLTDHYDRNPKINLLRGRVGYVESWVLDEREDSIFEEGRRLLRYAPKVVFVRYYRWVLENDVWRQRPCPWEIEGAGGAGIYPIKPWRRSWYLDQNRDFPKLEVKRFQLPLGPAYAVTSHSSQGQTLAAAIVDLLIGRGVGIIACYVAFTRVRTRADLLVYRNFARACFMQGDPEGPALLLQKLRGEAIDWNAVEAKHTPMTACHGPCLRSVCMKDEYSAYEWKNKVDPYCKICVKRMKEEGNPHRCTVCRQWRSEDVFATRMVKAGHTDRYVCNSCADTKNTRRCGVCGATKSEAEFPAARWGKELARRICSTCGQLKKCSSCGRQNDQRYFSSEEWDKKDRQRQCKDCVPRRCRQCRKSKPREGFPKEQWKLGDNKGLCSNCRKRRCMKCFEEKGKGAFADCMWQLPDDASNVYCKLCTRDKRKPGMWTCFSADCKQQLPKEDFVLAQQKYTVQQLTAARNRVCDRCMLLRQAEEARINTDNMRQTMKHRRR